MPFLKPMEPISTDSIDSSGAYLFQIKWDGIRLLADRTSSELTLYTRRGSIRTHQYPEIVQALLELPEEDFLLDGELIALNPSGFPDFQMVLRRDLAKSVRRGIAVAYMAFDCVRHGGRSLLQRPLEYRQNQVSEILGGQASPVLSTCENYDDGEALFKQMDALGMEGIVAKQRGSLYLPGKKLAAWQKIKCWREQLVTALAVNYRDGRPTSVVVGLSVEGQVTPVGSVATGLKDSDWRKILSLQANPAQPNRGSMPLGSGCSLRVRFLEWTNEGRLRAPTVVEVRMTNQSDN